jgi:hypothetical protein
LALPGGFSCRNILTNHWEQVPIRLHLH